MVSINATKRIFLFFATVILIAGCSGGFVEDATGKWKSSWTSSKSPGFFFECTTFLKMNEDLSVTGEIHWVLKKSPKERDQVKIGLTGIEYVKGTANKENRTISLTGFKKDDPNGIIGLDNYELTLQKGGKKITGKTYSGGSWEGRFVGEKIN